MSPQKQKLYCYVDETGQDTRGKLFLVVVVIVGKQRDDLRRELAEIERASGKHEKKWTRSTLRQREAYIRCILTRPSFAGTLYCSAYQDTCAYVDLTILSTAKAINTHARCPYTASVFVDGLPRTEQHRFGSGLRKLGVATRKVRGLNDQSDGFIRLADAVAGFVRENAAPDAPLHQLHSEALKTKRITEV